MNLPSIEAKRIWTPGRVREVCIANEFYTRGDCAAYDWMLNQVGQLEPTYENLYRIAADITEHSREQTVTNVMYTA